MERLRFQEPLWPQLEAIKLDYVSGTSREFFNAAIGEGAHLLPPENPAVIQDWSRAQLMAAMYFGSDAALPEVSERFGLTSNHGGRQIIRKLISELRANCSLEIQNNFATSDIMGKPRSERVSNIISAKRGGRRAEIVALIRKGLNTNEIAATLGMDEDRVQSSVVRFRKRGIAPKSVRARNRQILERARQAKTEEQIRQVLADTSSYLVVDNPDVYVAMLTAVQHAGFRLSPAELNKFIAKLEEADFCYGKTESFSRGRDGNRRPYYFLLQQQLDDAIEVWNRASELERFRTLRSVKQVAGPPGDLPKTTLLYGSGRQLVPFLQEVGRYGVSIDTLLEKSPVPIFKAANAWLVRKSSLQDLMTFARAKARAKANAKLKQEPETSVVSSS